MSDVVQKTINEITTILEEEGTDKDQLDELAAVLEHGGSVGLPWCGDSTRIVQKLRAVLLAQVTHQGQGSSKTAKLDEFRAQVKIEAASY